MRKNFEIKLSFEIPKEQEKSYCGDNAICCGLKEVLLDEIEKEANPQIEVKVVDNEFDVADLLNQQDKRIKELEEKVKKWINNCSELVDEANEDADNYAQLQEENQQLKHQLADSEKRYIKAYQEGLLQKQFDKDVEIAELKQQLAEKDKEIKQLKLDLGMFKSVNEFINSYGIEKAREVLLQTERTKQQDKISFAIEQLEKVKEVVKHFCELHSDEFYGVKSQVMGIREDVFEFIDRQLNELKGNVEKQ